MNKWMIWGYLGVPLFLETFIWNPNLMLQKGWRLQVHIGLFTIFPAGRYARWGLRNHPPSTLTWKRPLQFSILDITAVLFGNCTPYCTYMHLSLKVPTRTAARPANMDLLALVVWCASAPVWCASAPAHVRQIALSMLHSNISLLAVTCPPFSMITQPGYYTDTLNIEHTYLTTRPTARKGTRSNLWSSLRYCLAMACC